MRLLIIIFVAICFTSCASDKKNKIELISYYWRVWEDSVTEKSFVHCYIYAQLTENRECIVVKKYERGDAEFKMFKLDKEMHNRLIDNLNKVESDTALLECEICIYDGPSIILKIPKGQSKFVYASFVDKGSKQLPYMNFYKFIESESSSAKFRFDTAQILKARDELLNIIIEKEAGKSPIIVSK